MYHLSQVSDAVDVIRKIENFWSLNIFSGVVSTTYNLVSGVISIRTKVQRSGKNFCHLWRTTYGS